MSIVIRLTLVHTLTLALLLPLVSFAHENHPPGAPAHPVGSPEYHEVSETVPAVISEEDTFLMQQLAMLLEMITLLQQALGIETSNPAVVETDSVASDEAHEAILTTGGLIMTTDATYRYFSSDGLPEYSVSGNRYANTPSEQDHDFRVPVNPVLNDAPTYYTLPYTFGIALNGVTFEPFAAEWYQNDRESGWQEDPFVTLPDLDSYNAHVQPSGLYHYHGQPTNLMEGDHSAHSPVLGFAADGFPLYGPYVYAEAENAASDITLIDSSYELKSGTRPSGPGGTYDGTYNEDYEYSEWGSNSLDECNGRFGVTPEYPDGTYYYVATESYPYIPRCLMGDMDPSFAAGPPGR